MRHRGGNRRQAFRCYRLHRRQRILLSHLLIS
jgi:hypothetical protein